MFLLPWGIVLLMLVGVGIYFGLFSSALSCWHLSLEGALIILLLLIGADFITIPWHLENQVIQFHLGTILLLVGAFLLWFFQSGQQRALFFWCGMVCSVAVALLLIAADWIWLGNWFKSYWIVPFFFGILAAILTRNIAGVLWLTLCPIILGEIVVSFYWKVTESLWLTIGSSFVFDMALLAAGFSSLLVAAMQFFALRKITLR